MSREYYTLVASLPHLPRFDRTDRLPITRERLMQRLKMLHPDDYKVADLIAEFLAWRRQPVGRTNQEIISIYNRGVERIFEAKSLKPLFELPIDQRTIITALRRQKKGLLPSSDSREVWGVGPLVSYIEHHWNKPFFGLRFSYPWIVQAQTYFQEGEFLKLEFLLANLVWNKLDFLLLNNDFGFEAIVAYLLKWDLLQQWLSYDPKEAKARLDTLVMETINKYEHAHRKE